MERHDKSSPPVEFLHDLTKPLSKTINYPRGFVNPLRSDHEVTANLTLPPGIKGSVRGSCLLFQPFGWDSR